MAVLLRDDAKPGALPGLPSGFTSLHDDPAGLLNGLDPRRIVPILFCLSESWPRADFPPPAAGMQNRSNSLKRHGKRCKTAARRRKPPDVVARGANRRKTDSKRRIYTSDITDISF
ncbi:hypothetical protein [Ferrovibrio sp.]|uniref:hypothetical protein n=1 Tax=Ferrovibrio sp. TaxID=1917215 RepID=UPI0026136982|nr:hypothetical protein [Ferrovibrio sp.]